MARPAGRLNPLSPRDFVTAFYDDTGRPRMAFAAYSNRAGEAMRMRFTPMAEDELRRFGRSP